MGTEEGLSSSNHKNVTAGVNNKINLNNDNGSSNNGSGAVAAGTGTGATTKPKKTRAEKRELRREKKREEKKERGDGGGGGGGGAGLGPGVEKLKTVVRRLPPNLPEDVFWESVKPWATDETTAWRAYYKGKIRKKYNKENIPSRAYILFRRAEFLAAFSQAFDGHIYRDKTGKEYIAVVEFAPCQKVPPEKRKLDSRMGTIEQDEDFIAFTNLLNAPASKLSETDTLEALIAASQPPPEPKSTPLLDALRAEKQAQRDKETILKAHAHYRDQGKDDGRRRGKQVVDKDDGGPGKRRRGGKKAEVAAAKAKAAAARDKEKEREIIPRIAKPPAKEGAKSANPVKVATPANTQASTAATNSASATTLNRDAPKDGGKDSGRERRPRPVIGLNSRHFAAALNSAGLSVPKKSGRDDDQDKKANDGSTPSVEKGEKGAGKEKERNVTNSPGRERHRGGRKRGDSVKSPSATSVKLPDANQPPIILARPGGAPGILVRPPASDNAPNTPKPSRRRGGGGRGRGGHPSKVDAQDGGS